MDNYGALDGDKVNVYGPVGANGNISLSNSPVIDGKIFAALSKGPLLLKLPSKRVDALIENGVGERFSTGAGRPKKEWVTIAPKYAALWEGLAEEARRYVSVATR